MSRKMLLSLIIAAAVAIGAAALLLSNRQATPDIDSAALFADFASQADELDSVSIRALGNGESVTLNRSNGKWTVGERNGYPADIGKLRTLVQTLGEAQLAEAKTARAENHASLGLADSGDDAAIQITLTARDSFSILIGSIASRRDANYARRPNEAQTWLLNSRLTANTNPVDWIEKSLVNLPATDVNRVEINHSDGPNVILTADGSNYSLDDMPEGRELSYPSIGNTVAGALASLQLEDVLPVDGTEIPEQTVVTTLTTKAGSQLSVKSWQANERSLIQISASPGPAKADTSQAEQANPTAIDPDSDDQSAGESAEPDSGEPFDPLELNARVTPWVFEIAQYQFDNLRKSQESLLKTPAE